MKRRGLVAALVATLIGAVAPVALAPVTASAASGGTALGFTRIAGVDRYGTARLVAVAAFPQGATTVLVASGADFPDALSASYLAGRLSAPLLLVRPHGTVPADTLLALRELRAGRVILIGLDGAIDRNVQSQLAATPSLAPGGGDLHVSRIGGSSRYDTMSLLDETPDPTAGPGTVQGRRTAIVTTGTTFAGALAAGPLAFARALPMVLTAPDELVPQAAQTLVDLGIQQVVIAGGPDAVSASVEAAIHALGISTLARLGGTDRSDTARLIGDFAIAHLGFSDSHFDLASGDAASGGADGLVLAPLAAAQGGRTIQLLDSTVNPGPGALQFVRDALGSLQPGTGNTLAGGEAAAPDATLAPIVTAFASGRGVTSLPELVAAQTVAVATASGTLIRFIFDSAVGGSPRWDRFRAYEATEPNVPSVGAPGANGTTSSIDPVNPDAVLVAFPTLTGGAAADLSVAAVQSGAIQDNRGRTNPDGSAPIGQPHSDQTPPGTTAAPDILSMAPARTGPGQATTAIVVTFDKPAFSQVPAPDESGWDIVFSDQLGAAQEAACTAPGSTNTDPGGGSGPGGNGSVVWTVVCPDDPSTGGSPLTSSQIARIVIQPRTVGTAPPGTPGDVVAASVEAPAGQRSPSMTPDLESSFLAPPSAYGAPDGILVTFDQPVNGPGNPAPATPPVASRFLAVLSSGGAVPATAVQISAADPRSMTVFFPNGIDVYAVGISAAVGAVSGSGRAASSSNADDEIALGATPTVQVTPGRTEAPNLTGATLSGITSASGATVAEAATLTLSGPVAGPPAPALDHVHGFDGDGTELTCAPPTAGEPEGPPVLVAGTPTLVCRNWATGTSPAGPAAPLTSQQSIVLVTLDAGLIANTEGQFNPEEAVFAVGGTGVPQQG